MGFQTYWSVACDACGKLCWTMSIDRDRLVRELVEGGWGGGFVEIDVAINGNLHDTRTMGVEITRDELVKMLEMVFAEVVKERLRDVEIEEGIARERAEAHPAGESHRLSDYAPLERGSRPIDIEERLEKWRQNRWPSGAQRP